MKTPPSCLDGARVLAVSGLQAICRYPEHEARDGVYLFSCNEHWKVRADTWHPNIEDAQKQAAFEQGVEFLTWDNIDIPDEILARLASELAQARENAGLVPAEVAARLGFGIPQYYDLENCPGDLNMLLSLDELVRLLELLGLSARDFLRGIPSQGKPAATAEAYRMLLLDAIDHSGLELAGFEYYTGWRLADFLSNPEILWKDWTLDHLIEIARPAGINWLPLLQSRLP